MEVAMARQVCGVWLVWASVCGLSRADDGATAKELAKFEGTWTVVKLEVNGKSLLRPGKPEPKLVIKNGKVISDAEGAPKGGVKLSRILDTSRKPATLTLPLEGAIKFYGIYEVNGDELRVCGDGVDTNQEKNPEGRRPREFDSNKGLLIVFKRDRK
jgi:uncharacterized protein (TIGR03067 family)